MADVSVQTKEILTKYLNEVEVKTKKAILEGAQTMANDIAKANPRSNVNTDHMADSWEVEFDDLKSKAIIHNTGKPKLIHMLEFGTKKMRARPFLNPTFKKGKNKLLRDIADKIK